MGNQNGTQNTSTLTDNDKMANSSEEEASEVNILDLLNNLQISIKNGEAKEASIIAKQLAIMNVKCVIDVRNEPNTTRTENSEITLHIKIEVKDATRLLKITIPSDLTVANLKQMIEKRYGYPSDLQVVFFDRRIIEDEIKINTLNYKNIVILIKTADKQVLLNKVKDKKPINIMLKSEMKSEENIFGWKCQVCTYVNSPVRPGCEMCSTERPAKYVVPKKYKLEEQKRVQNEDELWKEYEKEEEQSRKENYKNYISLDDLDYVLNTVQFQCAVCFEDVVEGQGVELRNCLHHFCMECLKESISHCEDATVKCPYQDGEYSCDSALEQREIRGIVGDEVYEKLLQRSLAIAESTSKDSFHCKSVDCDGWCFFEPGITEFRCDFCKHVNCIPCGAIHERQTCKEYQDKLATLARTNDEARKTQEGLHKMLETGEAMKCPKCDVIIIKNGGCDGLSCRNCNVELCWATKGMRWGPKGRGDTSGGCRCGVEGKKCHPKCGNCH